jgi:zinc protease
LPILTTLDNGLRVLAQPTRAAPLAAVYLWLEAGSADEDADQHGAAHFLEHMIFKGTDRRGVGAAAAEIEGLGGDLNAFTSTDETVVHATVEAAHWAHALDVIADMVRFPKLDPAEIEREKQVVLEELRGYDDEPDSVLEEVGLARVWPDHAYGRPILGTVASLKALTAASLRAFHAGHYAPDRAILAVAGDVDPEEVLAVARRLLGDWSPSGRPRRVQPAAPLTGAPSLVRVPRDFETVAVELAWRIFPIGHPDQPALDVLSTALGEGAAGLLTTRLQLEENVASDVWTNLSARPSGGSLSFGFTPRDGKTAEAVRFALDEIAAVTRRGLSGTWIERARDGILADFLFGSETVDGVAHDLAWYTAHHGAPEARGRYRDAVAAVTAEDVRRVARAWLSPDRVTAIVLDQRVNEKRLSAALREHAVAAPPPPVLGPVRKVLPNGATVWVLADDSPVCAVHVAGLGGSLAETPRTAGIAEAWSRMLTAGAGELDASSFGEAIDEIAGTLDGFAGRSALGLRATFPGSWLREGLELVGAALVEPSFEEEEWKRVQEEMLDDVRTQGDHPEEIADQLASEGLWSGHPWALPALGTPRTIESLDRRKLERFHKELITADNLVIAVSGGVDPEEVHECLEAWLKDLPSGPYTLAPRTTPEPVRPGERRKRAGREQVHVSLSWRGLRLADPDRVALSVAAAALDGQGGRLFMALREAEGLAYAVWAEAWSGVDGGSFSAGLSTDPSRAAEARRALRAELARLADSPPDEAEVERYRRMLSGQAAMALQRASGRAADLASGERHGLPWGLEAHRRALASVDAAAVRSAVRRVLAAEPVEVVVEPKA